MKKIFKSILPGLLLITLATPGFAGNRQGAYTLSPFVGGYLLDTEQRDENRPVFGLRGGYNFTENWGAEATLGYSLTETKEKYGSRETDVYRYGLDALYHFMPETKLVPFIAVGIGYINFNTPNSPSINENSPGLFNYGAGLKYFVAPDVALRGDVRHAVLFHDSNNSYSGNNNLEYSVGLTFQFGGEKKTVAAIPTVGDTAAPNVVCTSPDSGATGVAIGKDITATFNEEMTPSSLSKSTFTVKLGTTPVAGKVTFAGTKATFNPASDLEKDMTYTATITAGVKDLAGNALASNYEWRFTTEKAADTAAPTVIFVAPVNGATAAPVNQKVNAAFSEDMDPATINTATFTLKQGTTLVSGKVTSVASNATFIPASDFEKGKAYTATITTGARDLAGNALANNYVWNFTSLAAPKLVPAVLITLEDSHFTFDSAEITENGKTILNLNIKVLKENPKMRIRIAGYTSAAGTADYNQKLSERRAATVKEYLAKEGGIARDRLDIIGYGERNPAEYEAVPSEIYSEAAKANMRVLFEVIVK